MISASTILVSIFSLLVSIPVSTAIIILFRKSKPRALSKFIVIKYEYDTDSEYETNEDEEELKAK